MKTAYKRKVLVYLFGSLGDTIVAIPALRAVRRHFGNAELVLLHNTPQNQVVSASDVIPTNLIDRSIDYTSSAGQVSNYFRLWMKIHTEKFDAAVYLVISERPARSVRRDRLFFRSCGIRELFGFNAFSMDQLYPIDHDGRPGTVDHEAVRKLQRLEADGIQRSPSEDLRQPLFEASSIEQEEMSRWLAPLRQKPDRPLLAMAPGCKTPANFWPTENFVSIAKQLAAEHLCEIVIVGGPAEKQLGDDLVANLGTGINAAGKFAVRGSAALLSLCNLYFGLDTGTTHLAAAVGTPVVALFHERDNPGQWFPLGNGHTIFQHDVACAGCRSQECPVAGHPCMKGISVEPVLEELRKKLRSKEKNASDLRILKV
ncbi:MAG: glycosyltransferase family 9 protein [Pyrinomonadaceae bacterium]